MESDEPRALSNIRRYGCHILHVIESAEQPRFTYSVGIEKSYRQPELIVTGLKKEVAIWTINEYCSRIRSGEVFHVGCFYSGFLENYQVTFKSVEKRHYPEYFGWGLWLYKGEDFRAMQLIYPSTFGCWPWEPHAPADYKWFLPKLYQDQDA